MSKLWHGYERTYFCHILPLTIFGYDQSLAWPLHDINQTGPKAMMHFSIKWSYKCVVLPWISNLVGEPWINSSFLKLIHETKQQKTRNLFNTQCCSTSWVTIQFCQYSTSYTNLIIEGADQPWPYHFKKRVSVRLKEFEIYIIEWHVLLLIVGTLCFHSYEKNTRNHGEHLIYAWNTKNMGTPNPDGEIQEIYTQQAMKQSSFNLWNSFSPKHGQSIR